MSLAPRIYPSLPEYTPYSTNLYVRPSQNVTPFPEYTPPIFQQLCDPPRIYPSLQEYTHPFQQLWPSLNLFLPPRIYPYLNNYMRPSQNLPLPPSIPLRIYNLFNNCMRYSQNLPLSPRIYPPFQHMYMYDPPRIYPSLPKYTTFSITICDNPDSTHPSQNIPPFQQL